VSLRPGTNGRQSTRKESGKEYLVIRSQIELFQFEVMSNVITDIPKKSSCLKKIEYVEPDCWSEKTLDAESTITRPSPDKSANAPIIK
jgi:hypothetical protein